MINKFMAFAFLASIVMIISCGRPNGKDLVNDLCNCYSTLMVDSPLTQERIKAVEDSCKSLMKVRYSKYEGDKELKAECDLHMSQYEDLRKEVKAKYDAQVTTITLYELLSLIDEDYQQMKKDLIGKRYRVTGLFNGTHQTLGNHHELQLWAFSGKSNNPVLEPKIEAYMQLEEESMFDQLKEPLKTPVPDEYRIGALFGVTKMAYTWRNGVTVTGRLKKIRKENDRYVCEFKDAIIDNVFDVSLTSEVLEQ